MDAIGMTQRILSAGGWDWRDGKPEWVTQSADQLAKETEIMRLKAEAYDRAQDRLYWLHECSEDGLSSLDWDEMVILRRWIKVKP